MTPQDFIGKSERSIKRNPLLAQLMYYPKDIESFGTGLTRISDACEEAGIKIEFQMLKMGFAVVFYRPDETSFTTEKITGGVNNDVENTSSDKTSDIKRHSSDTQATLSDRKSAIMTFLEKNEKATSPEIAKHLGVSSNWVRTILRNMAADGKVEKVGDDRYAYYVLKR
jgi:ATP-dependent DNA helicase RecG